MPNTNKSRVLSGVQPTGNLHLGNYLGAILNWSDMQDDHECLFMLADLHAITVNQDAKQLTINTRETAAAYLACGINPTKSTVFVQSQVHTHSELAWLLNCHTPLGWLNRMTQFKDKAGNKQDNAVLGLYSYPVLMAADILAYNATHVPVGQDQKQHLELTRDIAGAVNRSIQKDFFAIPEPLITTSSSRVMSLRDGTKKMSKSDASEYSRINLTDSTDQIVTKIMKAKTDAIAGISYDIALRPEISNLIEIYCSLSRQSIAEVVDEFHDASTSSFKRRLADCVVYNLAPISNKIKQYTQDTAYLDGILKQGQQRALEISVPIVSELKKHIGFVC